MDENNNNNLPILKFNIHNIQIISLLDSGASISPEPVTLIGSEIFQNVTGLGLQISRTFIFLPKISPSRQTLLICRQNCRQAPPGIKVTV